MDTAAAWWCRGWEECPLEVRTHRSVYNAGVTARRDCRTAESAALARVSAQTQQPSIIAPPCGPLDPAAYLLVTMTALFPPT